MLNKPKFICISGKARAGKDTSANMIKEYLEKENNRVLIIHYADLLKFICTKFFNWNGEKDEAGRQLLQAVGTDIVRKKYPDYWVNFILSVVELFPENWSYIIIPDVRFPNEITKLSCSGYDVYHIRITTTRENALTSSQKQHISETALDDFYCDFNISNNGSLEELKNRIASIISSIS